VSINIVLLNIIVIIHLKTTSTRKILFSIRTRSGLKNKLTLLSSPINNNSPILTLDIYYSGKTVQWTMPVIGWIFKFVTDLLPWVQQLDAASMKRYATLACTLGTYLYITLNISSFFVFITELNFNFYPIFISILDEFIKY